MVASTEKTTVFDEALDWEASKSLAIAQSEQRAWRIVALLSVISLSLAGVLTVLIPLKRVEPYIITVDKTTGATTMLTTIKNKAVGYDEVMDKYWLAQYLRAYETYDWHTLQHDYDIVGLFSGKEVGANYARLFEGKEALDKVYGNSTTSRVTIVSLVPNNGIATIRFIKKTQKVDEAGAAITTHWIATVAYQYRAYVSMTESERLLNPLGFQVMSYRVDPEITEQKR